MRAVFLDSETLDRGDLDLDPMGAGGLELTLYPHTRPAQVAERIAGATIVILNKVKMDRALLAGAPGLKLICIAATGSDNVDLDAARDHGVAVCNIRDYCSASVSQHVFAMILGLTQQLADYDGLARGGDWQRHPQFCMLSRPQRELAGLTLGIVGHGTLGKAVATLGAALGMHLLVSARPGEHPPRAGRVPLEQLLSRSDVVSLHCPLTAETRHLISDAGLALMKPDALLINTARGALVDPHALARALKEGRLGGAGIDVLEEEPPVSGNPLLDPDIPRLIVTPHVAWAARQARQRAVDQIAETIAAFMAGRALPRRL